MNNWFEVDKAGLAKILARKGLESAVFELIQNAWDEDGITTVKIALMPNGYNRATLVVEDDAPAGFADLSHTFTLFAESKKKSNPEKRGRFNLGEKLVLAICEFAEIISTTGTVVFDRDGRRRTQRRKTECGSTLTMRLRATKDDCARVAEKIKTLIVPPGISLWFNGNVVPSRESFSGTVEILPTEIADTDGNLVKSRRKTYIGIFEVLPGETGTLYEMGIPVVETGDKFHYNIGQKVPLTMDRENVPPSFLAAVRVAVYNVVHDRVTNADINDEWVQEAAASPHCGAEAAKHYVETKFGDKRVSFDPSDPEANNRAVANGYTVVHGAMMHKGAWENARNADAITPAGQVFPTHSENIVAFKPAEITPGMREVEAYAKKLAQLVLGCEITIEFGNNPTCRHAAMWGTRSLSFNVPRCGGPRWFDLNNNQERIDDLIIHEFGHHYCGNHLDDAYYDALTKIGAKMVRLAREGKI